MNILEERSIHCPYCDERITVLIDCSLQDQSYIEDCQVCCQPIVLDVQVGESGQISINASMENA